MFIVLQTSEFFRSVRSDMYAICCHAYGTPEGVHHISTLSYKYFTPPE